MAIKAVLFDLDGTIINSEEGITKCVQYTLRHFGIEEPDLKKLTFFIGPPLEMNFKEHYGFSDEQAWEGVLKYRERFDREGIFECELYEGVEEVVKNLHEAGYVTAIASSKPEVACERILDHFSLLPYFDMVVGATLDKRISTKAQVLEELGRRMAGRDISKDEMVLIGDTKFDVLGANAFGIRCIGVDYGFGTREELETAGAVAVFDNIKDVKQYIEKENH